MDPFLYAYDAILYPSHYSHLQNRVETIRIHHNFLWFVMFFLAATTSHWRILFISSFELFMSLTGDFFKVYLIFLKIGCLNFVFFYFSCQIQEFERRKNFFSNSENFWFEKLWIFFDKNFSDKKTRKNFLKCFFFSRIFQRYS